MGLMWGQEAQAWYFRVRRKMSWPPWAALHQTWIAYSPPIGWCHFGARLRACSEQMSLYCHPCESAHAQHYEAMGINVRNKRNLTLQAKQHIVAPSAPHWSRYLYLYTGLDTERPLHLARQRHALHQTLQDGISSLEVQIWYPAFDPMLL